jgi:hypothetical protein
MIEKCELAHFLLTSDAFLAHNHLSNTGVVTPFEAETRQEPMAWVTKLTFKYEGKTFVGEGRCLSKKAARRSAADQAHFHLSE